jgi:IS5 family transposase
LLRALLLQALYSVRSERMLMEQLDYNLLFRWFVGLNMDDSIWDLFCCILACLLSKPSMSAPLALILGSALPLNH